MGLKLQFQGDGLVFILGVPRSGTTWTWGLLISHPEVEPLLIEDFPGIKSASGIESMKTDQGFVTSETTIFFSNLSDEEILEGITQKRTDNPEKIIVEKTPSNALQLERITKLFPNARYIVLERDPRAVISSMLNTKFQSGRRIAENLQDAIEVYKDFYAHYSPYLINKNFLAIQYEYLSSQTRKCLADIFRFIGVKDSSFDTMERIIETNAGRVLISQPNIFRRGLIDGYKSELSKRDIRTIEIALKPILIKNRYKSAISYVIDQLKGGNIK